MSKKSGTITAERFVSLLLQGGDTLNRLQRNTIVSGPVRVDGRNIKSDASAVHMIDLQDLVFLDGVTIEHYSGMFNANGVNFRDGIRLARCSGAYLYFTDCEMTSFGGYSNQFERVSFRHITGEQREEASFEDGPHIDLSGLTVKARLEFAGVKAREVMTAALRSDEVFTAPAVTCDDPLWINQFRLLGIPVHVNTDVVRKMMLAGSGAVQSLAQAA